MKNKYLIIIGIVVILLIIVAVLLTRKDEDHKPVEVSKIKSFEFGYTVGYAMWSNVRYRMDCELDGCNVIIKLNGVPEEEQVEGVVGKEQSARIEELLAKYSIGNWNGFNKSDKYVLDGDSFHLYVHFENEDSISASGYMMYPKNYREFKNEIDSFFDELKKIIEK